MFLLSYSMDVDHINALARHIAASPEMTPLAHEHLDGTSDPHIRAQLRAQ
jgi:hypothetical protein